jgi:hypothetical protein
MIERAAKAICCSGIWSGCIAKGCGEPDKCCWDGEAEAAEAALTAAGVPEILEAIRKARRIAAMELGAEGGCAPFTALRAMNDISKALALGIIETVPEAFKDASS